MEWLGLTGRLGLVTAVMLVSAIAFVCVLRKKYLPRHLLLIITVAVSIFTLYLTSSLNSLAPNIAIYRGGQVVLTVLVLIGAYYFGNSSSIVSFGNWLFSFSVLAIFFLLLSIGYFEAQNVFLNPNTLGMAGYLLLCLTVFGGKQGFARGVISLFALLIVILSGSRASLLACLIFFFTYLFFPIFRRNKFVYYLYIFLILGSGFWVVLFVTGSISEELLGFVDALSREYLNKRIESGRNLVWAHVISLVAEAPYWGWGGGIELSDLSEWEFSVHNLFLQVSLQSGLVGLVLFMLLILVIWGALYGVASNRYARVAASAFAGLLTLQFFEITLFQNNLALSFPIIVIVGLALGCKVSKEVFSN